MTLPRVPLDSSNERQHRTVIATTLNEVVKVRPPFDRTQAEVAAGVTPLDYTYAPGNVLRYGADPAGDEESTRAFSDAFSIGIPLLIPKGTYLVDGPLTVTQGMSITCEEGVTVSVPTGGMTSNTAWIQADNIDGLSIIGNNSIWQFTTKPVADEQRIIFRFRGCTNLNLNDIVARKAGGDGFYFGASTTTYCSGVGYNLTADDCRRNGYSIISAQNFTLDSCRALNIDGTDPQCGIDIEPNDNGERLINVRIVNFYSENCTGEGITLFLEQFDNTTDPVSVVIDRHEDNGSTRGGRTARGDGLTGSVRWLSPVWRNNVQYAYISDDWGAGDCLVELFDPQVIDCNQGASAGELAGAAIIAAYRDSASALTYTIGSVHVYRPNVRQTLGTDPVVALYATNEDDATAASDIRIIDPISLVWSGNATRFGDGVFIQDRHRVTRRDLTASSSITRTRYYSPETNEGAGATTNRDLTDWDINGTERTFEVRVAQALRVRADQTNAALRLLPDNVTNLASAEIGARITVRRDAGGFWITERIGTWA